jgi:hypothetical protein
LVRKLEACATLATEREAGLDETFEERMRLVRSALELGMTSGYWRLAAERNKTSAPRNLRALE